MRRVKLCSGQGPYITVIHTLKKDSSLRKNEKPWPFVQTSKTANVYMFPIKKSSSRINYYAFLSGAKAGLRCAKIPLREKNIGHSMWLDVVDHCLHPTHYQHPAPLSSNYDHDVFPHLYFVVFVLKRNQMLKIAGTLKWFLLKGNK